MTARILSQHGNVIAADFRPSRTAELTVNIHCETIYCDGLVTLIRVTMTFEGKPYGEPQHILGNLATGQIVNL